VAEQGAAHEARRLAAHWDWSSTSLGPMDQWPPELRNAWDLTVECPLPMALLCRPDFTMLYNDAFGELLGSKHPRSFAQPAQRVVSEVWDLPTVGALLADTMASGTSFLAESTELQLARGRGADGDRDVGYYLRSGSPILDAEGEVLAVLHVIIETTAEIGRARAVPRGPDRDHLPALAGAIALEDGPPAPDRGAVAGRGAAAAHLVRAGRGTRVARGHGGRRGGAAPVGDR
jgi:hypothetical protein